MLVYNPYDQEGSYYLLTNMSRLAVMTVIKEYDYWDLDMNSIMTATEILNELISELLDSLD